MGFTSSTDDRSHEIWSREFFPVSPAQLDEQRQDDQLEPTYNSSVLIKDVALKTYREQWTIEKGGGRVSERSTLAARYDDDIFYS